MSEAQQMRDEQARKREAAEKRKAEEAAKRRAKKEAGLMVPKQTVYRKGKPLYRIERQEPTPLKVPRQTVRDKKWRILYTIEAGEEPGTYVQTVPGETVVETRQVGTMYSTAPITRRKPWVDPGTPSPETEQFLDLKDNIQYLDYQYLGLQVSRVDPNVHALGWRRKVEYKSPERMVGERALETIEGTHPEAYRGYARARQEQAAETYERSMALPTQRTLEYRMQLIDEAVEAKQAGENIEAGIKYAEAVAVGSAVFFREAITTAVRPYKIPLVVKEVAEVLKDPIKFQKAVEAFERDPLLTYAGLPAAYLGGKALGELGGALSKEIGLEKPTFKGFDPKAADEAIASKWPTGKWPPGTYDKRLFGESGVVPELIRGQPRAVVYVPKFVEPLTVKRAFEIAGAIGSLTAPLQRANAAIKRVPRIESVTRTRQLVQPLQISEQAMKLVIRNIQDLEVKPDIIPIQEQRKRQRVELTPAIAQDLVSMQEQTQEQADAQIHMLVTTQVQWQRTSPKRLDLEEEKKKRKKRPRRRKKGVFELRVEFKEPEKLFKEPKIPGFEIGTKKKKGLKVF